MIKLSLLNVYRYKIAFRYREGYSCILFSVDISKGKFDNARKIKI